MTDDRPGTPSRFTDLVARLTGRSGRRSEQTERRLLALAVVVFVATAGIAIWRLPELEQDPDPTWGLAVMGLAFVALLVNAAEFAWSARVLAAPVGPREAVRVSTLSSAANVLPIPGSVAMRTRALLQGGLSLGRATTVTTAVGVVWVSAAALAAAVLGVLIDEATLAVATGLGGLAGTTGGIVVLRRAAPACSARRLLELAAIETASVTVSGVRLYAVARTLGFDVNLGQAVTVNLGGILSNVAGLLPGGLGLREVASGAFGALVGVPGAVGVLMAAGDRIGFYVVLALTAVVVLRTGRAATSPPAAELPSEADEETTR